MTPLKKGLPEGGMSTFMSSAPYEPLPALPLKDADIVVIADVAGEQPFWSENGATIYTDYSLTIHMQIKSPPGAILASSLLVTQAGGGIADPDGRNYGFAVGEGLGRLRMGRRYLLFLDWLPEPAAGTILQAYEVVEGRLCSLGYRGVELNGSSLSEALKSLGQGEAQREEQ